VQRELERGGGGSGKVAFEGRAEVQQVERLAARSATRAAAAVYAGRRRRGRVKGERGEDFRLVVGKRGPRAEVQVLFLEARLRVEVEVRARV
jgi:hypothetical protein